MLAKQLMKLFINTHVFLYRLTGGKIGANMRGMSVLLLTTTGRRSGKERTVPLMYIKDGTNYVIAASNGGQDRHPGWFWNLQSNSQVKIQVEDKVMAAVAEQASPQEKSRLWKQLAQNATFFEEYQQNTTRQIPLVILQPAG
ncbi:MAG: nitroreductase family deazaflavin-dependent oxidoreductase [Ardenticatenaceae bacterium]